MKRIIGIDCFKLEKGLGKSIGIYTFAERLVKNLAKREEQYEVIVFGNRCNRQDFDLKTVKFIEIPMNYKNKYVCVWWELFLVAYYIQKYRIEKIILPRGYTPLIMQKKCMAVIHDMIPFYYHEKFPGVLNPLENFYIMSRLKASIIHADKVVTISEYSKKEIMRIVPNAKERRIRVILHGYEDVEAGNNRERSIALPYIFAIASMLPHKNAIGIVNAYENYFQKADKPIQLLLVGVESVDGLNVTVSTEIKENIICKKYLADDEFYELFRHAECLLFLPLIEGYGFPPLEAMQFRVPAIVSNRTSLPEVVGTAGILVDPENSADVAAGILEVLSNWDLRYKMKQDGVKNLKRFDWNKKIDEYMEYLFE